MEISPSPKNELRSRLCRIATAVAFALVIGSVSVAPARAEHGGGGHGGGHGGGGDHRGGGEYHGGGGYHGGWGGYHGGWGGGYYAPGPDFYVAPEPYVYAPPSCYGPDYDGPEYYCNPPPPEGVNLFFGL